MDRRGDKEIVEVRQPSYWARRKEIERGEKKNDAGQNIVNAPNIPFLLFDVLWLDACPFFEDVLEAEFREKTLSVGSLVQNDQSITRMKWT